MRQFSVTGMSCAACSARVEKAVSAVAGVTSCSVSLLTNSMAVDGTAEASAIVAAVEAAGYQAAPKDTQAPAQQPADALADRQTPALRRRLIVSLVFLAALMYCSMGYVMWGWPLPAFFDGNPEATGLLELLLAGAVLVINQRFFISGWKGLMHRAPNMDTLVALGSGAAFLYSICALFAMTGAQAAGEHAAHWLHELYFESAAMILTLITVGKLLEARARGKTTDALQSLMRLAPQTATVLRDGAEATVPVAEVRRGDLFVVRPGESIPVDGTVRAGESAVNEAALTGESIPVDKAPGDPVSAGTINQSGFLQCEASRVGEDTTLAQIIRMVSDAAATKAPIAKTADRVSAVFVPAVMGIALVTTAVWLVVGQTVGYALARGVSVLVISCPCALGLATPVAIMVGSGMGAKNGLLFKTAASLEEMGRVEIVALDKTGTVTAGTPEVTDVLPVGEADETGLLQLACALEQGSEHPLAHAVLAEGARRGLSLPETSGFEALPGNGVRAQCAGQTLLGGSLRFISGQTQISREIEARCAALAGEGKTPLLFCRDGALLGVIAVADAVKPESPEAIRQLHAMGVRVVMLTGDNARTAAAVARQAGVDEVVAGVLPDGKQETIRRLQRSGKVAMVGDGINDAPALACADVGVAIGAGADVAVDAADVVLVKSRLTDVPAAIRLSRATLRNIRENLFWAFFYNVIGIPLAAGLWVPIFGWTLAPMFGAAAMSLSSFCVVTNALRLNLLDIHDARRDRVPRHKSKPENEPQNKSENGKERKPMGKTLKIEGMMCPHCEGRVKKALEQLDGVTAAQVSWQSGTAVVTLAADVSDETLRRAVEAQDYTVLGVE
ncbi:MAG: heavy metal translocating P-type ATPase [Clostridiales bacterium]|nr:heavy metal translocating P-type ATPase [Clostridiales bacterium]